MKLNGFQRSTIAAVAFASAFAGLVFLQFSRDQRFQDHVGDIGISGINRRGEEASSSAFPDELRLSFHGMVFQFAQGNPLAIRKGDGSHLPILPVSWKKGPSSVRISFERSVVLTFSSSMNGLSFSVSASAPDLSIASILLPYGLSGASFEERKGEGIILKSRTASYSLGVEGGTRLDAENHILVIQNGKGIFDLALKESAPKPSAAPSLAKLAPMEAADYRSLVAAWTDKTWNGLSKNRLAAGRSGWSLGNTTEFSEQALMVLFAEAHSRGVQTRFADLIQSLSRDYSSRLSWRSDPLFGGIVRKTNALFSEDKASSALLKAQIDARDPSLFLQEGLVTFLLDRAPASLSQSAFDFASTLDTAGLSVEQASGYAACMAEAETFMPGVANPFRKGLALIDKTILPAVKSLPGGAYLSLNGSGSNLRTQLRLGLALVDWGNSQNSPKVLTLGQRLVEGVLSLADENGVLPASIGLGDKAILSRQGFLAPEDVYPLISDNPWYPRETSLFGKLGQGSWIWAAAPDIEVSGGSAKTVFSVRYPTGSTHFMTIFGLKPFAQIKLYEIPYGADEEFERYNVSGYLYVRPTSTLYLKMTHKKETELIDLSY